MYKGFANAVEVDFSIPENREKMLAAFKQVDEEKGLTCPLIIGGERIFTEKKFESLNPATKEVLGYSSSASAEQCDQAIKTAHEAFLKWKNTSLDERIRCMRKLAQLLDENRFYLDAWNVEESGKNWGEADGELCELLDFINSYCVHIQKLDQGISLMHTDEHNVCKYIPMVDWYAR